MRVFIVGGVPAREIPAVDEVNSKQTGIVGLAGQATILNMITRRKDRGPNPGTGRPYRSYGR